MSFDIRKFLTENKLTKASRVLKENYMPEMEEYTTEEAPMEEPSMEETLDDQPLDVDPTDGDGVNTSFDPSKYESVEQLMREIEVTANRASLQEKMKRVKEAYESLDQKATALEEGEDSKYMSSTKLREMKKNAKTLRKMYEKYEKDYDKRYNEQMKPRKKSQVTVKEAVRAFGGNKTTHTAGSILEPVLQQVNDAADYESAKEIVLGAINDSGIAQEVKDKMIASVEGTKTYEKLLIYTYNAYLAKAGLRTPDSGSRKRSDEQVKPKMKKINEQSSQQRLVDLFNTMDLDYNYSEEEFNEKVQAFLEVVKSYDSKYNFLSNEDFYNKFFDVVDNIEHYHMELYSEDPESYLPQLNQHIYEEITKLFRNPTMNTRTGWGDPNRPGDSFKMKEGEELKIKTVSRADAGKAIRGSGTGKSQPKVGPDYQGMRGDQVKTVKRPLAMRAMRDREVGPVYDK